MQDRREGPIPELNQRRRTSDHERSVSDFYSPGRASNLHKEVWSPLDFDKKFLDLADKFLDDEEKA